jgi:acyl-CoA thioesterase
MSFNDDPKEARRREIKDIVNNSPFYKYIQMELTTFTETGCIVTMNVGENHMNALGIAHGGTIASLADSACGLSLLHKLKENEYLVTQNLIVNYLSPVQPGLLTAKGSIVHQGSKTVILQADIYSVTGKKVAHAQTTHAIRTIKK